MNPDITSLTARTITPRPDEPLRDQFAMAALTGLCAFPGRDGEDNKPEHFAKWAYAFADAMLKARAQP